MPGLRGGQNEHSVFTRLAAEAFRRARWKVHRGAAAGGVRPDLIVEGGGRCFAVVVKRCSEGRRDRLIPLLSQAILEVRSAASESSRQSIPLAVVGAERIPPVMAEQLKQFAARHAPGVGVGIVDAQGLRAFSGYGLEVLDTRPSRPALRAAAPPPRLPQLFSDLNQWMLKLLLGQFLAADLLSVPRGPFRSATELANAADVSLMSASRLVRQLRNEGFLDDQADSLRIVRVHELMARWVAATQQGVREIPVRGIIQRDPAQLLSSLAAGGLSSRRRSRRAVGLFAAADALGFGFVRGVPPHLYLERVDHNVLRELGFSSENASHRADAYVRVPAFPEAVFRAAVQRKGAPVCDVLQVWLDVSSHPARGQEQADQIRRRALGPLFERS